MSWKPEVLADASGKWYGNGLRFATILEAQAYVCDLGNRWSMVTDIRTVESEDPVTHRWNNEGLKEIPVEDGL